LNSRRYLCFPGGEILVAFFFFFFDEKEEDSDDEEHRQDRQTFEKDVNELIVKFVGHRSRRAL